MTNSNAERIHRYSLKTLQALYDGSVGGRASARGALRLTITDEDHHTYQGRVLSVGHRIRIEPDDGGPVRRDIKPAWVDHAEVV